MIKKRLYSINTYHINLLISLLCIFSIGFISSCGSNSDNDQPATGSVSFQIQWPGDETISVSSSERRVTAAGSRLPEMGIMGATVSDDCSARQVAKVSVEVRDAHEHLLVSDEFKCNQGMGKMSVPVGSDRAFFIYGLDADGYERYYGEKTGVDILAGANDIGVIQMERNAGFCTDNDGDGYYAESDCGTAIDCDDNYPSVYPGASEICGDGVDQDCDGVDASCVDNGITYGDFGVTEIKYEDSSNWDSTVQSVFGSGYRVADWNDLKAYHNGGGDLLDLFDGLGLTAYKISVFVTRDGDRTYSSTRFYIASRHEHNQPSYYVAHDNIDNYLISLGSDDGPKYIMAIKSQSDTWNKDADGDGYTENDGDCNDSDASIHPGATEICDGKDNDCDNSINEGNVCKVCTDSDKDGYYAENDCGTAEDCNDTDPDVNPGETEKCNDGIDNDCDGSTDEGCFFLFDDFEDGNYTSSPAWVDSHHRGSFAIVSDPEGSGGYSLRIVGTATAHQEIESTLPAPVSWKGFYLSADFFATNTNYYHPVIRVDSDSGFHIRGRIHMDIGKDPSLRVYLDENGTEQEISVPSPTDVNKWWRMELWHDTYSNLIKFRITIRDKGTLICNHSIQPASDLENLSRITSVSIAVEEIYNQYIDNVTLKSGDYSNVNSGLIAYYPFNGNANDESGNGNDGNEFGGIAYNNGKIGLGALFDGIDSYIEIPYQSELSLNEWTFSLWVKPLTMPENRVFLICQEQSNTHYNYSLPLYNNNTIRSQYETATSGLDHTIYVNGIEAGKWHYITATRSSAGEHKIYLNAVMQDSGTWNDSPAQYNTVVSMGRDFLTSDSQEYLNGYLDEVRIYNRALSESEIQQFYNQ